MLDSPVSSPPASAVAPSSPPPWRTTTLLGLRCWLGALLLMVIVGFTLAGPRAVAQLGEVGAIVLAAAVLAIPLTLVVEQLSCRRVPLWGHALLGGVGLAIVVGLFSLDPAAALLGFVLGFAGTGIGALLLGRRPTWPRALAAIALAVALAATLRLLGS